MTRSLNKLQDPVRIGEWAVYAIHDPRRLTLVRGSDPVRCLTYSEAGSLVDDLIGVEGMTQPEASQIAVQVAMKVAARDQRGS